MLQRLDHAQNQSFLTFSPSLASKSDIKERREHFILLYILLMLKPKLEEDISLGIINRSIPSDEPCILCSTVNSLVQFSTHFHPHDMKFCLLSSVLFTKMVEMYSGVCFFIAFKISIS